MTKRRCSTNTTGIQVWATVNQKEKFHIGAPPGDLGAITWSARTGGIRPGGFSGGDPTCRSQNTFLEKTDRNDW